MPLEQHQRLKNLGDDLLYAEFVEKSINLEMFCYGHVIGLNRIHQNAKLTRVIIDNTCLHLDKG